MDAGVLFYFDVIRGGSGEGYINPWGQVEGADRGAIVQTITCRTSYPQQMMWAREICGVIRTAKQCATKKWTVTSSKALNVLMWGSMGRADTIQIWSIDASHLAIDDSK